MEIQSIMNQIVKSLPGVLGAVVLLVLALFLALVLKKLAIRGLTRIDFDSKLQKAGMSRNSEESATFTETIGTLVYFITILFFAPFVLTGLNVSGVVNPFFNMMDGFVKFLPHLIIAILILVIGSYFCNFVKSLLQNLFEGINVDRWYRKMVSRGSDEVDTETRMAEVLASLIYVLIFIPIIRLALEILGIKSISTPITNILDQIVSAIPNVITAIVLIMIGSFIAKLISDLLGSMLSTSGIDHYSQYLNFKGETSLLISTVVAQAIRAIFMIFFIVEAVSLLQLDVLNAMGRSIISYMPSVISSVLIMAVGIVISNIMASFLCKVSGSKLFGEFIRYGIITFVVFMTLEQLQFAQSIVSISFAIILGAIAIAFSLAFGLGGRDFAAKQLEKAGEALASEDTVETVKTEKQEEGK